MSVIAMVIEAAKRPGGMRLSDIDAHPGTVGSAITRAINKGLVFRATISHRVVRYYGTKAEADHCVATTAKPKASGWGVVIHARPRFDHDAPMVITPNTKFTYAPIPVQPTHTNTYGQLG